MNLHRSNAVDGRLFIVEDLINLDSNSIIGFGCLLRELFWRVITPIKLTVIILLVKDFGHGVRAKVCILASNLGWWWKDTFTRLKGFVLADASTLEETHRAKKAG